MRDDEPPAVPEAVTRTLEEISERLEVMQQELDARAPVVGPASEDDDESSAA